MTDYTPTTEQVRDAYVRVMRDTFIASAGEHREEFDRWMQAHEDEVRASVQPPTREQIAEVVNRWRHDLDYGVGLGLEDRLVALFSQPSPSAPSGELEPFCDSCGGPYDDAWLAMYARHWDTCPNRVIAPIPAPVRTANGTDADRLIEFAESLLGAALDPWQVRLCSRVFGGNVGRISARPEPEPPRIEDMAPGTTFIGNPRGWMNPAHWVVTQDGRAISTDSWRWCTQADIDPSTIRDVMRPKGDDRG